MNNRSAVLTLLNARGPMSRKDIADELGLTPASVTQICNDMFAAGILTELGEMKEEKRAGRRKILVGINYKVRNALAIAIEANEATITISDLKGEVMASRRLPPLDESDPKAFVRLLSVECKLLMWENSIPRESMLGVGVSVPGNVNRALGICQHPNQTINSSNGAPALAQPLSFTVRSMRVSEQRLPSWGIFDCLGINALVGADVSAAWRR